MTRRVVIGTAIAEAILELMRSYGKYGDEVAVLLAGKLAGDICAVDRMIVPVQQAFQSVHGCALVIEGGCLNRVGPTMRSQGRRILGIMHSHPSHAFHSAADDEGVLMRFDGAFSLVVPDFGARSSLLDGMAAFVFDYARGWVEVDVSRLVTISAQTDFEVIIDDIALS